MKSAPFFLLGALASTVCAWSALVFVPLSSSDIGGLNSMTEQAEKDGSPQVGETRFPRMENGQHAQGALLYGSLGCNACHTQQVLPATEGADFERGFGRRGSVARDYINQDRALLGQVRVGPDLANAGLKLTDADAKKQAELLARLHLYLYNPRAVNAHSTAPAYAFLYEVVAAGTAKAPDAFEIPEGFGPHGGPWAAVPTEKARQLVRYLQFLSQDYDLPEAKRVQEKPKAHGHGEAH